MRLAIYCGFRATHPPFDNNKGLPYKMCLNYVGRLAIKYLLDALALVSGEQGVKVGPCCPNIKELF